MDEVGFWIAVFLVLLLLAFALGYAWIAILIAFLAASVLFTAALKNRLDSKTYLGIFSMIRTKKPLPLFDRISKAGKIIDYLAELGIVLGFGMIAVDYLYGRNKPLGKRIAIAVISFIVLAAFFHIVFNSFISGNPITAGNELFFDAAFGLFGFAGFIVGSLLVQGVDILAKMFLGKKACPGVAPLIPGVEIPNVPFVPIHAWISLLIILVVHEGFHGVVARREKQKVKNAGLLLFGFLPIGAFVEPDEKQLLRAKPIKQLRVFAAGPVANLCFAGILLAILSLFSVAVFAPLIAPVLLEEKQKAVLGVQIDSVSEKTDFCGESYANSAFGVLQKGDKIVEVNGKAVHNLSDFMGVSKKDAPMNITVERNSEQLSFSLERNPLGLVGITVKEIPNPSYKAPENIAVLSFWAYLLAEFFFWLLLLSFLVAVVNFLPMEPFDGGRIAKEIFSSYLVAMHVPKKQAEKTVRRAMIYLILIILAINALPLFY